jgi:hypothetical protein
MKHDILSFTYNQYVYVSTENMYMQDPEGRYVCISVALGSDCQRAYVRKF